MGAIVGIGTLNTTNDYGAVAAKAVASPKGRPSGTSGVVFDIRSTIKAMDSLLCNRACQ